MKKHLIALLSLIGFAGSVVPAQPQVLKGADQKSKTQGQIKHTKTTGKNAVKSSKTTTVNNAAKTNSKLKLKQETLQKQTTNGGKNALTKAGLTKAALTKAKNGQQQ